LPGQDIGSEVASSESLLAVQGEFDRITFTLERENTDFQVSVWV
jgi:hypothetical protein